MSLDTKVKNLIINTNMTKEQYEAIDDKSNQLFFVEDSSVVDVPAPEENQSGYLHTDGANLTWKEIESGDKLPDQTDNAGKFLMTDGENASWGEALVNKFVSAGPYWIDSLNIGAQFSTYGGNAIYIGTKDLSYFDGGGESVYIGQDAPTDISGNSFVSIGYNSHPTGGCVMIGSGAQTSYHNDDAYNIGIGYNAVLNAQHAIQLSATSDGATNSDDNTFKVANANGNFEMMDANGKVPLDRLTYVTDQIGDISTVLDSINGETLEG